MDAAKLRMDAAKFMNVKVARFSFKDVRVKRFTVI